MYLSGGTLMSDRRDLANAIRFLTIDVVQRANSGHPGTAMGMADIAEVLWNDFLRHNPANPKWLNRDRFVQSNGHGSMLIYSLLHLSGYGLTVEDLQDHRKLHSRTPGHPEYGVTPGIETTTGPLGQGFATAVGMALAERKLAQAFNREGFPVVDHFTYVFVGDGCLMEGVTQEAASLAGTLKLNKLIAVYDDNKISIDGETPGWFADDTPARFRALGWNVVADVDGHDAAAIAAAFDAARRSPDKPTMICCKTIIGYGAPTKQGKEEAHGAPLGVEEVARTRESLHRARRHKAGLGRPCARRKGGSRMERLVRLLSRKPPGARGRAGAPHCRPSAGRFRFHGLGRGGADPRQRTRPATCPQGLEPCACQSPEDPAGGDRRVGRRFGFHARLDERGPPDDVSGNFVHYGVREFGMSAMMNGMAAHGGLIPYGACYLVFSDYSRNAVRLSALMGLKAIFLYTHDSIGVGEDGPTHQPCEQLLALRAIPSMSLWRPGSELEALVAWESAMKREGPTVIAAARQEGGVFAHHPGHLDGIRKGGYVLHEPKRRPDIVLAATGSELGLALDAAKVLEGEGRAVRIVSIPNGNLFAQQDRAYQDSVLSFGTPAIFVEAASPLYWYQFLKGPGTVIGVDRFGESAPGPEIYRAMNLTADRIVAEAEELLG
jgi:transketolase